MLKPTTFQHSPTRLTVEIISRFTQLFQQASSDVSLKVALFLFSQSFDRLHEVLSSPIQAASQTRQRLTMAPKKPKGQKALPAKVQQAQPVLAVGDAPGGSSSSGINNNIETSIEKMAFNAEYLANLQDAMTAILSNATLANIMSEEALPITREVEGPGLGFQDLCSQQVP
jgi:hypothetical protein